MSYPVRLAEAEAGLSDSMIDIQVLISADPDCPLQPDSVIEWYGRRIWLRESFSGTKRIGVHQCCDVEQPCDWHRALAGSLPSDKTEAKK